MSDLNPLSPVWTENPINIKKLCLYALCALCANNNYSISVGRPTLSRYWTEKSKHTHNAWHSI